MANLATFLQNPVARVTREAEVPSADWEGGGNLGGSNANGIGINTGFPNPKLSDWSLLDQNGDARNPQLSQHIGGSASTPLGDTVFTEIQCPLNNGDNLAFVTAAQDTPNGSGLGAAGAEPLNRTGATVLAGQRCWGTLTVI